MTRVPARRAFTLLELVVVVAILVVVAGGVVATLDPVVDTARLDIARAELVEVRRAVLAFQADTGALPRCGPLALETHPGGRVRLADLPVPAALSPAEREAWFEAPENLLELYTCPLPAGDPLAAWDPDRRRGWHGPYLGHGAEGEVVGAPGLPPMPAVADPFLRETDLWFEWDGATAVTRQGGPVRLVDVALAGRARLLGAGPDGELQSLAPPAGDACVAPGSDDLGLWVSR